VILSSAKASLFLARIKRRFFLGHRYNLNAPSGRVDALKSSPRDCLQEVRARKSLQIRFRCLSRIVE